jgi:hypothetical protein
MGAIPQPANEAENAQVVSLADRDAGLGIR